MFKATHFLLLLLNVGSVCFIHFGIHRWHPFPSPEPLRNQKLLLCKGKGLLLVPKTPKWTGQSSSDQLAVNAFQLPLREPWGAWQEIPLSSGFSLEKRKTWASAWIQIPAQAKSAQVLGSDSSCSQWGLAANGGYLPGSDGCLRLLQPWLEVQGRQFCATSPTLKGEHRKHFLSIQTQVWGGVMPLCSFLSKGHCKRDTSELTSVTAGDDYCGLAEMCSCWDSVQWSGKVQTSVRDPLAKFPHFFMLLLVLLSEGKAFVFVHLLFIGGETYLCIPTPIPFAECHSLEISFFLPLGSFPFELLAFAYIQYCMMVHCLGGSATNRSCWLFCWHSRALMMVRTRATRLGLSSPFSLL